MNIKKKYKINPCEGVYDSDEDSYCSLVSWENFTENYQRYIDYAVEKRENTYKYDIVKRM